jgi:hypothetical protein
MSGDAGNALGGLIIGLILIYVVIYVIALVLVIGAILALITLGIVSFFMAKSGKALVRQSHAMNALAGALAWAATLSVGLLLGSLGLFAVLQAAFGADFNQTLMQHYGVPTGPYSLAVFLFDWIVSDSYSFFLKVSSVLYFANRVFVARLRGGWHWLGVAPPVFAFAIFFAAEHFDLIVRLIRDWNGVNLNTLIAAVINEIIMPADLILMAIVDPSSVLAWGREALISTEGSFFKLGTYFPSLFCIVALLIAGRHLFYTPDSAAN